MTGETLNYKRHVAIPFGKDFQINEVETPRSSTRPRTRGAVCMCPRGNKQGGFNFMTLGSMKNVAKRSWDAILMPDIIIAQLNARSQRQPNNLDFIGCRKHPIVDLNITVVDSG